MLALKQRNERQQRRGRVAAGAGGKAGRLQLLAGVLGQAVHSLFLKLQRGVRVAVPLFVGGGVAQAEVGGKVDHLGRVRTVEDLLDDLLAGGVRQAAEHGVDRAEVDGLGRHQIGQRIGLEVRPHRIDRLAGLAFARQCHDLDLRMGEGKADEVRARVAGGAQHRDLQLGHWPNSRETDCYKIGAQ